MSSYLKAQPILRGCLIGTPSAGTLYVDQDILQYYQMGGMQYQTSPPACPRALIGIRDGDCYFAFLGTRHDRYRYTIITTSSSPTACDIDHYALFALVLIGGYGIKRMVSNT